MKNQMKTLILSLCALLCLCGCSKVADSLISKALSNPTPSAGYVQYTIHKGQQFCDQSALKAVQVTDMQFTVLFDSSAIYQTQLPENQYDINKLYGFSDNNMDHHQYSARIGWRWSDHALRLFAYIYNAGVVSSQELTTIPIGQEVSCEIKVADSLYQFRANDATLTMPRLSKTHQGSGYQLYPYFGGDETAPHDVRIWIKDERK
jgi:uncharacterized protein YceK